jgi:hypothetical protein
MSKKVNLPLMKQSKKNKEKALKKNQTVKK